MRTIARTVCVFLKMSLSSPQCIHANQRRFIQTAISTVVIYFLLMLSANAQQLTKSTPPTTELETVATFDGPMPTGVTVSQTGRTFVCFPRWGDPVEFTVAELKDGKPIAFPNKAFNQLDKDHPEESLISVQSVVVDQTDRLWILDTGSTEFGPVIAGGAKLIGVDLKSGEVFKKIIFPDDIALSTTYLNDVRFDLQKGKSGVAYITDSSMTGPNAIILVDLETGKSRRLLNNDPSTKAETNFKSIVEGRPLMNSP